MIKIKWFHFQFTDIPYLSQRRLIDFVTMVATCRVLVNIVCSNNESDYYYIYISTQSANISYKILKKCVGDWHNMSSFRVNWKYEFLTFKLVYDWGVMPAAFLRLIYSWNVFWDTNVFSQTQQKQFAIYKTLFDRTLCVLHTDHTQLRVYLTMPAIW